METTKRNFYDFVGYCNRIANKLQTIIEVKDYSSNGFGLVSFMTDRFGGTYVHLHFDMATGVVTNWYGHKDAKEIKLMASLPHLVRTERDKMLKARNMEAVYDMINSQY